MSSNNIIDIEYNSIADQEFGDQDGTCRVITVQPTSSGYPANSELTEEEAVAGKTHVFMKLNIFLDQFLITIYKTVSACCVYCCSLLALCAAAENNSST